MGIELASQKLLFEATANCFFCLFNIDVTCNRCFVHYVRHRCPSRYSRWRRKCYTKWRTVLTIDVFILKKKRKKNTPQFVILHNFKRVCTVLFEFTSAIIVRECRNCEQLCETMRNFS